MKEITVITTLQMTNILKVPDDFEYYDKYAVSDQLKKLRLNHIKASFPEADDMLMLSEKIFIHDNIME